MRKFAIIVTTLLATMTSWSVSAEEVRYITDELSTSTLAGPSAQHRITGSIASGEKVGLIELTPSGKYALIRDANNKQSWILADKLVTEPSARQQVPALKKQVQSLSSELATINESWNSKIAGTQSQLSENKTVIANLQKENSRLTNELTAAQKKIDDMTIQLDGSGIIQQWFMYGGGVAGAGLLLGLILPLLIPRRKSKRWMN